MFQLLPIWKQIKWTLNSVNKKSQQSVLFLHHSSRLVCDLIGKMCYSIWIQNIKVCKIWMIQVLNSCMNTYVNISAVMSLLVGLGIQAKSKEFKLLCHHSNLVISYVGLWSLLRPIGLQLIRIWILVQADLSYPTVSGLAPIRLSEMARYDSNVVGQLLYENL